MLQFQFLRAGRWGAIRRCVLAVCYLGALCCTCARGADQDEREVITPDKAIQEQIERTVEAFYNAPETSGRDRAMSELVKLEQVAGRDRPKLIQQLLLYESQVLGDKSMMPLVILQYLHYSDGFMVEALAPYVNTEDPKLRHLVRDRLEAIDRLEGEKRDRLNGPNYRVYERYVRARIQREKPIPLPLVGYMYGKAPGMALLAFVEAHQWRLDGLPSTHKWPKEKGEPLVWAEHVVSEAIWREEHRLKEKFEEARPEAIAELEKLSKHDTWWVRLYVAEILQQHSAFRSPEMVERLKKDAHELVREAITRPEPKKPVAAFPPSKPAKVGPERK
jgi:hypothetical protein